MRATFAPLVAPMLIQDPERIQLSAAHKARRINRDPHLYGTFAEIGAGQETVRHFCECLRLTYALRVD